MKYIVEPGCKDSRKWYKKYFVSVVTTLSLVIAFCSSTDG